MRKEWSIGTQLEWHAAVTSLDSGVPCEVVRYPTNYCVATPSGSVTVHTSLEVIIILAGIGLGARSARHE